MLPTPPKNFPTFYLIRHAVSQANVDGVVAGRTESPLIPEGVLQARLAGDFVRKNLEIKTFYCSPSGRTMETAAAMGVETICAPGLMETNFGILEGASFLEWVKTGITTKSLFSDPGRKIPGGESYEDVAVRIAAFLSLIRGAEDRSVLGITHGGFVKFCLFFLFGDSVLKVTENGKPAMQIENAQIIEFSPDGFRTVFVPAQVEGKLPTALKSV
jgi:broad specificity phosphatase PhoE